MRRCPPDGCNHGGDRAGCRNPAVAHISGKTEGCRRRHTRARLSITAGIIRRCTRAAPNLRDSADAVSSREERSRICCRGGFPAAPRSDVHGRGAAILSGQPFIYAGFTACRRRNPPVIILFRRLSSQALWSYNNDTTFPFFEDLPPLPLHRNCRTGRCHAR